MIEVPMHIEVNQPLLEEQMLTQFNRLTALDFIVSGTIQTANQMEQPAPKDWVEQMTFTRNIVRRAVFASLMDIYDHGSLESKIYAVNRIRAAAESVEGAEATVIFDSRRAMNDVAHFISDLQGFDYERDYMQK